MTSSVTQKKKSLRALIRLSRRMLFKRERAHANREMTQSLLFRREYQSARTVCLYMSYPNEADTKTIFADLLSRGVTVAIPRAENGKLVLRRVMSIKDFTRGSYGILEPRKSCAVISADQVDLFIVPGIAFDKDGYRLGRGKGYYDKLLTGVHADIIGLAFDIQVVAEVPHFSYDVPMTAVVTESYVYENKTS